MIDAQLRESIFARDGYRCVLCGVTGQHESRPLSIDHIHPQCAGGGDEPSNLRTLCRSCNSAKSYSDRFAEQLPTEPGHLRNIVYRMPVALSDEVAQRAASAGLSRSEWTLKAIEWAVAQPIRTETIQRKV